MLKLTDLPTELIQAIMNAAHPLPDGRLDSRFSEQIPAAKTFGALRLTCRNINAKVLTRYLECLFSVHTIMLDRTSLQTVLNIANHQHLRNALGTLFIDTRNFAMDYMETVVNTPYGQLIEDSLQFRDLGLDMPMFLEVLQIFPNLKEISIEHITSSTSRMACLGAKEIEKKRGQPAELENVDHSLNHALRTILPALGTAEKELIDLQIRIVMRPGPGFDGDWIDWGELRRVTKREKLTVGFMDRMLRSSDGLKTALKGVKALALTVKGPASGDDDEEVDEAEDEISDDETGSNERIDSDEQIDYSNNVSQFKPETLCNFIAMSPILEDLTVYFATGQQQARVKIEDAIPWNNLPNLWALELGGARFDYGVLVQCLSTLQPSLRILTLRHVALDSVDQWISLIRFLHTRLPMTEFAIWSPAGPHEFCFRDKKGNCYQRFRSRRLRNVLPENLDKYLLNLKEAIHEISWRCPWSHY